MSTLPDDQDVEAAPQPKPKREGYAQLPHVILLRTDLSDGDKVCYATLDYHWRRQDVCRVYQKTLAREMNVSVDTVQRRLDKLVEKKLIKVTRRGLTRPNEYKRLPLRHLQAVPDEAPDDDPETAPARFQEAAPKRLLTEVDEVQTDDVKTTVASARQAVPDAPAGDESQALEERLQVVRCMEAELLPLLKALHHAKRIPYDKKTGLSLARLIQSDPGIHEGHIAHLVDKFTGEVPDGRYSVFDVDSIENPAAYAYTVLAGRNGALPQVYEALRDTAWTYDAR